MATLISAEGSCNAQLSTNEWKERAQSRLESGRATFDMSQPVFLTPEEPLQHGGRGYGRKKGPKLLRPYELQVTMERKPFFEDTDLLRLTATLIERGKKRMLGPFTASSAAPANWIDGHSGAPILPALQVSFALDGARITLDASCSYFIR